MIQRKRSEIVIDSFQRTLVFSNFLYADDTKIIGQISEYEELPFDIDRAIEESGSNKLKFNLDKFSVLEFSYKNRYDSTIDLFPKDTAIKNEKQIKDHRLIFVSNLTWNCHLQLSVRKRFQKLNYLRRVKPHITKAIAKCTLVKTYIFICDESDVWDSSD